MARRWLLGTALLFAPACMQDTGIVDMGDYAPQAGTGSGSDLPLAGGPAGGTGGGSSGNASISAGTASATAGGSSSPSGGKGGTPGPSGNSGSSAGVTSGAGGGGGAGGTGGSNVASAAGVPGSSAGAGGSGGAIDIGPVSFAQIQTYLVGYCATSTACHGTGAREIELRGDAVYAALMDLIVGDCQDRPMVVPFDPAGSAFLGVLNGNCGNFRMPPGCTRSPCGTAENRALVERWIADGALPE